MRGLKKRETEEQAIERRKKMYGCDGLCYLNNENHQFCGGIDTCEETRVQEGIATALAVLTILLTPIAVIVAIVVWLFNII